MDFDFELDTGPLDNLLKQLPEETQKKVVRRSVAAGARVIRDGARELAPYDPSRSEGTHLRDAVMVKRLQGTNDIMRIGTLTGSSPKGAPHAHLVEFGTVKMSAKPFLRPAALFTQQATAVKMFRILANGIFREAKKLAGKAKKRGKK